MKWDWIFFDADETLFTFDSFTGLQRMFLDYSVTFTAEDFQDYQAVNKPRKATLRVVNCCLPCINWKKPVSSTRTPGLSA